MPKYVPVKSTEVPRFAGVRTFLRLPHVKTTEEIDYAVIGIPFDTGTTFRSGARFGPQAIRDISVLVKPYNYVQDVNIAEELSGVDYGDVSVITGFSEDSLDAIAQTWKPLVDAGVIPIGVGGDHLVTLGELRALAKKHGPLALVHFDSHTDTVDSYFGKKFNHGTPFARAVEEGLIDTAHSIQLGMRSTFYSVNDIQDSKNLGFDVVTAFELHEMSPSQILTRIEERVGNKKTFLTFDIDFVDPAYAPGTGTPEVGGFTSAQSLHFVRGLRNLNFVGFDVVEVLPMLDHGEITALLASNLMFEFISILAYQKKYGLRS